MRLVIRNEKELAEALVQISMLSAKIKEKSFDIEIKEHRERRTLDANAYFHLLVNKIAQVLKIGNDECKFNMNLEYGTPMKIDEHTLFACKVPKEADIKSIIKYPKFIKSVVENGKELYIYMAYKETHTLDKAEFSRLIEGTVYEAKQLNIETLDEIEFKQLIENYNK